MGLFDGVFKSVGQIDEERAELLKYQQALANEEIAQRRITAAQQQKMYGTGIGAQMGSTQHAYNQAMQQKAVPLPRFDPNKSEAFLIPLSQAVTMWQVKHGDKWYDAHHARPPTGDDFYTDVFDRIKKEGLFENVDGWYRLKENVETLLANH
jgi:hypothetical protein